jgi:hypothetical protein
MQKRKTANKEVNIMVVDGEVGRLGRLIRSLE